LWALLCDPLKYIQCDDYVCVPFTFWTVGVFFCVQKSTVSANRPSAPYTSETTSRGRTRIQVTFFAYGNETGLLVLQMPKRTSPAACEINRPDRQVGIHKTHVFANECRAVLVNFTLDDTHRCVAGLRLGFSEQIQKFLSSHFAHCHSLHDFRWPSEGQIVAASSLVQYV